jgi:hypothetical protein
MASVANSGTLGTAGLVLIKPLGRSAMEERKQALRPPVHADGQLFSTKESP